MVIELKENVLSKRVHPDLLSAEDLIYKPSGLFVENLNIEEESKDYGAAEFTINHHSVKFRVGKITPTKIRKIKSRGFDALKYVFIFWIWYK